MSRTLNLTLPAEQWAYAAVVALTVMDCWVAWHARTVPQATVSVDECLTICDSAVALYSPVSCVCRVRP